MGTLDSCVMVSKRGGDGGLGYWQTRNPHNYMRHANLPPASALRFCYAMYVKQTTNDAMRSMLLTVSRHKTHASIAGAKPSAETPGPKRLIATIISQA